METLQLVVYQVFFSLAGEHQPHTTKTDNPSSFVTILPENRVEFAAA